MPQWQLAWVKLLLVVLIGSDCGWARVTAAFQAVSGQRRHHYVPVDAIVLVVEPRSVLDVATVRQIDGLVEQRAAARWAGDYERADAVRAQLDNVPLLLHGGSNDNNNLLTLTIRDEPRRDGGGSQWSLVYHHTENSNTSNNNQQQEQPPRTVLHVAHAALGLAVSCAERGVAVPPKQLEALVESAVEQLEQWRQLDRELRDENGASIVSWDKLQSLLINDNHDSGISPLSCWKAVHTHLRGRKAADAAFWFAVAGCDDCRIFDLLAHVSAQELQRFGDRCSAQDVYQIVERLAAAGVRPNDRHAFETIARQCLETNDSKAAAADNDALLDLHSDRAALLLWRFSNSCSVSDPVSSTYCEWRYTKSRWKFAAPAISTRRIHGDTRAASTSCWFVANQRWRTVAAIQLRGCCRLDAIDGLSRGWLST